MMVSARVLNSSTALLCAATLMTLAACKGKQEGNGAPPPAKVVTLSDMNRIQIPQADVAKFPVVAADGIDAVAEIKTTGSIEPDVSREVPVITLANGRVVEIKARLDDNVRKGQLLLKVQSPDATTAFNAYLKASNDEHVAAKALARAEDLYKHGAIAQAALEQAEGSAKDAHADLMAAEEQLKTLGIDRNHPSNVVPVYAPISGVIVAQNVTQASAAGSSLAGSPNAFTIADLSTVWVVCDLYENDMSKVALGDTARVEISAYPGHPLTGRISDIGPILDPNTRTAKVRIELRNPGNLKLGMFANATFTGKVHERHAGVPADAVLHLHDRDWVFVPAGGNQFTRREVRAGRMIDPAHQEVVSGLNPGEQVVTHALMLETAGGQQ